MKAIFTLDKEIKKNSLLPRDIRNLVGAVMKNGKTKDALMNKDKNGHTQSKFVYSKPRPKSFDILNYTDDIREMVELEAALVGKKITTNGNDVTITGCRLVEEGYQFPEKKLSIYSTRTPIIISGNPVEHKIAHHAQKDSAKMENFLKRRIENLVALQVKQFFGKEFVFNDLEIKLISFNTRTITPNRKERPNEYVQGVYCEFVSNYSLPRYVGYLSGLGYGELLSAQQKVNSNKRGKKNGI